MCIVYVDFDFVCVYVFGVLVVELCGECWCIVSCEIVVVVYWYVFM